MSLSSTRNKSDLILIAKITLTWMSIGLILTFYDFLTTTNEYFYTLTENFSILTMLSMNLSGAFIGGITAGSFLVLFSARKLRKKSFPYYVLVNSIVILVLVFIIDFLANMALWSVLHEKWFYEKEAINFAAGGIFHILSLRSIVIWFTITLSTTFLIRISEGFGPGVVTDIIKGRYHKPIEEERIFMFLDIKSSTSIAEKLGHNKYFQLLNDFFADITDAIFYSKGDIYQYVGDEVVVSWRTKNGLQNNNCLNCFFQAQQVIDRESTNYQEKYGLVPEFKAGLHVGYATVGEIGILKKIIAFSGDALNTTSRIQSNCNKFNAQLLISEELQERLEFDDMVSASPIGEIELRGRTQKTMLYSIEKTNHKIDG